MLVACRRGLRSGSVKRSSNNSSGRLWRPAAFTLVVQPLFCAWVAVLPCSLQAARNSRWGEAYLDFIPSDVGHSSLHHTALESSLIPTLFFCKKNVDMEIWGLHEECIQIENQKSLLFQGQRGCYYGSKGSKLQESKSLFFHRMGDCVHKHDCEPSRLLLLGRSEAPPME